MAKAENNASNTDDAQIEPLPCYPLKEETMFFPKYNPYHHYHHHPFHHYCYHNPYSHFYPQPQHPYQRQQHQQHRQDWPQWHMEPQIPFLDFSFFPVGEDVAAVAAKEVNTDSERAFEPLPHVDHSLMESFADGSSEKKDDKDDECSISDLSALLPVRSSLDECTPSSDECMPSSDECSPSLSSCTDSSSSPVSPPSKSSLSSSSSSSSLSLSSPLSASPPKTDASAEEQPGDPNRFKPFHEEKWNVRYKELTEFIKENGHGAVPHTYPKNPQLARWVKRQRRQYKLLQDGKASTMTSERLELLNNVGFVWDSHDVSWREKLEALREYSNEHGHCNVPSNYKDRKLATWVKCQRRQYKLYWSGKTSAMCPVRILELENLGFEWEIRIQISNRTHPPEDYQLLQQNISEF